MCNKIKSMFLNTKQIIRKWMSMFNWNCNNILGDIVVEYRFEVVEADSGCIKNYMINI